MRAEENRINRRDKKRAKKRWGMRMSGNSVKLLARLLAESKTRRHGTPDKE